ncbi:MAG: hypothetical protein FJ042_06440, partial [Candidatus Cloacimonetes bacterium]|nr:hypothetical protein [Candidatus Cloacimonadota bacterium]
LVILIVTLIWSGLCAQSKGTLFLKSIVIPGWGQLSSDRQYGYAMLTSEALAWMSLYYFDREVDLRNRESYEYALRFAHIQPGSYADTYFSDLSRYNTSGFEAGGFNDMIRRTALELYPHDPVSQQQYIDANIYNDDFAWNWDSVDNRKQYNSIRIQMRNNKDYIKIVTGVLIFNHLVSAVDILRLHSSRSRANAYMSIQDKTPTLNLEIQF